MRAAKAVAPKRMSLIHKTGMAQQRSTPNPRLLCPACSPCRAPPLPHPSPLPAPRAYLCGYPYRDSRVKAERPGLLGQGTSTGASPRRMLPAAFQCVERQGAKLCGSAGLWVWFAMAVDGAVVSAECAVEGQSLRRDAGCRCGWADRQTWGLWMACKKVTRHCGRYDGRMASAPDVQRTRKSQENVPRPRHRCVLAC